MKVVEKGRTAELKCEAIGQPNPTIFWVKDGLQLDILHNPRYTLINNGNVISINSS